VLVRGAAQVLPSSSIRSKRRRWRRGGVVGSGADQRIKDRQPNPIDDDRSAFFVYAVQMLTLVVIWHAILSPDGVRP
jgi:hypothetical protein